MSGGQQQRVALARALVNRPTVLLLDEPLGALDLKLRKEMQLELKALQQEVGITFVYVTHDQEEALTMSDMIVVMRDGLIQQHGPARGPLRAARQPVRRRLHRRRRTRCGHGRRASTRRRGRAASRRTAGSSCAGTVTDPRRPPAAGDRVIVAIRPERLRVEPAAGTPDAPPRPRRAGPPIPGRVHQGTYLGDQTEYRIQTDQAGELVVRRQNQLGARAARASGPGEPVTVRWHEDANLVLAG